MIGELLRIAGQCDGVRCDMAMLVLPEVFERTWGRRAAPFWPEATQRVREQVPGLPLHGRGLLGPGVDAAAAGVRLRLRQAALRPPARRARPAGARAPSAPGSTTRTSSPGSWRTTTSRGRPRPSRRASTRPRRSSPSCRRACASSTRASSRADGSASRRTWSARRCEPVDDGAAAVLRRGCSRCCGSRPCATASGGCSNARPAWDGNWTWDCFIAFAGRAQDGQRLLVAVNYAPNQSQCYVRLPFADLAGRAVRLKDLLGPASYDREGSDLVSRGLYLDLPPWGYHVFEVAPA